jgi:hypothetical protein
VARRSPVRAALRPPTQPSRGGWASWPRCRLGHRWYAPAGPGGGCRVAPSPGAGRWPATEWAIALRTRAANSPTTDAVADPSLHQVSAADLVKRTHHSHVGKHPHADTTCQHSRRHRPRNVKTENAYLRLAGGGRRAPAPSPQDYSPGGCRSSRPETQRAEVLRRENRSTPICVTRTQSGRPHR